MKSEAAQKKLVNGNYIFHRDMSDFYKKLKVSMKVPAASSISDNINLSQFGSKETSADNKKDGLQKSFFSQLSYNTDNKPLAPGSWGCLSASVRRGPVFSDSLLISKGMKEGNKKGKCSPERNTEGCYNNDRHTNCVGYQKVPGMKMQKNR